MGIYRTYFDKNNTIVKNSYVNTAKNPVSELYCGANISRFLFFCNFSELSSMAADKSVILDSNTRHILKIKNTSDFDVKDYLNIDNNLAIGDGERATSIDLELRPMTQFWDEGTGYDFNPVLLLGDQSFKSEASNWYQATINNRFHVSGATDTNMIIGTQHMDNGDENIEIDITNYVNAILTTGVTVTTYTGTSHNYQGFCLKYTDQTENAMTGITRTLGLYTKYTQTFFEPFIETYYDDLIKDDRVNFYPNKDNNLFLYVNVRGNATNLDSLPTCTISGITYTVQQKNKGVYFVTVPAATSNMFDTYTQYNDIWSGLVVNGVSLPNVSLKFIPLDNSSYYQIGSNTSEPVKYAVSLSGIKFGEVLDQGNIRRVNVLLRKPYTLNDYDFVDNVFYRLYVKQGNNLVEVLDWQEIGKSYDSHFFNINTTWMIPQTYYIDIKTVIAGEVNIYNEELKFTVNSKIFN